MKPYHLVPLFGTTLYCENKYSKRAIPFHNMIRFENADVSGILEEQLLVCALSQPVVHTYLMVNVMFDFKGVVSSVYFV